MAGAVRAGGIEDRAHYYARSLGFVVHGCCADVEKQSALGSTASQ